MVKLYYAEKFFIQKGYQQAALLFEWMWIKGLLVFGNKGMKIS
jgi:hypothetical protein